MEQHTDNQDYILLCAHCAKDIGISPEELANSVMLPKPLSDEEIEEVINRTAWVGTEDEIRVKIARAIEAKVRGEK